MSNIVLYAVLGLGTGSILALLALGLVLIFRGAGVVNLAQGAYAIFSAYLVVALHKHGWPLPLAIIVAILASGALGGLTDQLLLRRLRQASGLTRLIATVGLLLLIQSAITLIWGVTPEIAPQIIPSHDLHILGAGVPSDRIWLVGIALVIACALALVWRFTRLGWIAEAVSESQQLASALGWSPELVSTLTWSVGAALAGAAGILIAPITEIDPTVMPLLVVPALAAALIGGFRSFPLTVLGAFAIGIAQSEIGRYVPISGAADALPFLILAGAMILGGTALPVRGHAHDRLPYVGTGRIPWKAVGIAFIVVIAGLALISSDDWLAALSTTFAVGIILLSFVVLVGYTGQLSLAQFALAGFGALFAAKLVASLAFPFWAALVLGSLGASLIGVLFALPALRTRGVNLAVVTLGLSLAAEAVIFNNATLTGGLEGILVNPPRLFGFSIDPIAHATRYAIFAFVALTVSALFAARVRRRSVGRLLLAVRDNESATASTGASVLAGKIVGFAIAGALAGLGGIILAFQEPALTFAGYDPITSVNYLADSVIGGVGFIPGALFGSILSPSSFGSVIALHWQKADLYIPLIGSVLLLFTLATNPHGWAYQAIKIAKKLARQPQPQPQSDTDQTAPGAVVPTTLEVRDLTVRYGGITAVDAVSLTVNPGEVVGLIGANGAGKTSFMDAVTGYTSVASGKVTLNGIDITHLPAHQRARAGIVRSFQHLELFSDLSVRENVQVAADASSLRSQLRQFLVRKPDQLDASSLATMREFELAAYGDALPENLPYGRRRLLGIARALAAGPRVLLVDEPIAGLDDSESSEFVNVITRLARDRGIGVLVIDHDMSFVMKVCDRIALMDFGHKITEGTPQEVGHNPVAIAAYLGEPYDESSAADGTEADQARAAAG